MNVLVSENPRMRSVIDFTEKPNFDIDTRLLVALKNCLAHIKHTDSSAGAEGEFGVESFRYSLYLDVPVRAMKVLYPSCRQKVVVFLDHERSGRWSSVVALL